VVPLAFPTTGTALYAPIPDAIANSSVRADTTGVMVSVVPLGSLNSPDVYDPGVSWRRGDENALAFGLRARRLPPRRQGVSRAFQSFTPERCLDHTSVW
jgi:hypothetical protein